MDGNLFSAVMRRYAAGLSDDEIQFLVPRLSQGYTGDFAEAMKLLERDEAVSALFAGANGFHEFEAIVEEASAAINHEAKKRSRPRKR